jgi:hypothetical protein
MRVAHLLTVGILLALTLPVWAADDGQTQPKLNQSELNWSVASVDIVPTTNGAGNVKGVQCVFIQSASTSITVKFYVNGGSAQSISIDPYYLPADSNGAYFSGFIPYNVRFSSSIRVQLVGITNGPTIRCSVSWALD